MEEYESLEGRIWRKTKPFVSEFGENVVRGAYSAMITFYRTPTFIRKMLNQQTILHRHWKEPEKTYKRLKIDKLFWELYIGYIGAVGGVAFALPRICDFIDESLNEIAGGDYNAGLVAWLTTNVASGIFEAKRFNRSREEYRTLKKQKENENVLPKNPVGVEEIS